MTWTNEEKAEGKLDTLYTGKIQDFNIVLEKGIVISKYRFKQLHSFGDFCMTIV